MGNRRNRILLYRFLAAEIRALHYSYGVGDEESYKRALTLLENCERYTIAPEHGSKEHRTRAACKEFNQDVYVTSGDQGLVTFTVDGKQAVLIDPILLCDGCYKSANCSNRGTRDVEVYVCGSSSWVRTLSNGYITGDSFVSLKPGAYRGPMGQELNALVVDLFIGNRECPTRHAVDMSSQSWEARTCVVRWKNGKFTYRPL